MWDSSADSGSTTSIVVFLRSASSGCWRQIVRVERSGRVSRKTNCPSRHPSISVSRIACRLSIFGRCGNCAKAPTRSLTRRAVSPDRHRSYGPSGSSAS